MKENNVITHFYNPCSLCPRQCRVYRGNGERGFCMETDVTRVASACLHYGEEPALTGSGGSGTVFFTGCTIQCRFCQNYQISSGGTGGIGAGVTVGELAGIYIELEKRGAENINLVTGTHCIPGILSAIKKAKEKGCSIPFVWNSSGYERKESLALLAPFIDIWVPDLKTLDPGLSHTLFGLKDYPEKAKEALVFMDRQRNLLIKDGIMKSGMILRHLVLPGKSASTKQVLAWYKQTLSTRSLLSLMFQYIPLLGCQPDKRIPGGYVSEIEYENIVSYCDELGIEEGFIQEPAAEDTWLPDFTRENPFPPECAVPVWHYSKGFIR
jgi:putative pyruvate formate lyase activating enzyme